MASELIPLRGGPTLSLDVIEHVLDFGDRGFTLVALPDGTAQIHPGGRLTAEDRAWLDTHKPDMRAAIRYLAAVDRWPIGVVGSRLAPAIHPPARPAIEPRPARAASPAAVPPAPVAEPRQLALHAEAD
jgi:hypothetical protein